MKRFIIDIDGTICSFAPEGRDKYKHVTPYYDRIAYINWLFDQGNHIVYWTSRGMSSGLDWGDFTREQLDSWGCKYHELRMDKPMYDHWIDDKAENSDDFGHRIKGLYWENSHR